VDRVLGGNQNIDRDAVFEQLGVCEASDWFWWLGGSNTAADSTAFDSLFREHLAVLYRMLGEVPPADLGAPVTTSPPAEHAEGTMRRANR
jgi:alpha-amylase/alpha-mannosidase (GH57 family)